MAKKRRLEEYRAYLFLPWLFSNLVVGYVVVLMAQRESDMKLGEYMLFGVMSLFTFVLLLKTVCSVVHFFKFLCYVNLRFAIEKQFETNKEDEE